MSEYAAKALQDALRAAGASVLLLCALLACARVPAPAGVPPVQPTPAPQRVPAPMPPCRVVERIVIEKQARRLVAWCRGGARFETVVAFGRGGLEPKAVAGDMRTPEGVYHVAEPPRPSRFHRFVPLDYPSLADADRGLVEGRIGVDDHARIAEAFARGEMPPGDTPLGGEFGLHGEGDRWRSVSADLDWTLGCLAVDDAAIDFLAERLPVGTPVDIRP
jgi:hypothetical protein